MHVKASQAAPGDRQSQGGDREQNCDMIHRSFLSQQATKIPGLSAVRMLGQSTNNHSSTQVLAMAFIDNSMGPASVHSEVWFERDTPPASAPIQPMVLYCHQYCCVALKHELSTRPSGSTSILHVRCCCIVGTREGRGGKERERERDRETMGCGHT